MGESVKKKGRNEKDKAGRRVKLRGTMGNWGKLKFKKLRSSRWV